MKLFLAQILPAILAIVSTLSCSRSSDEIDHNANEVVYISEEFLTDNNRSSKSKESTNISKEEKSISYQPQKIALGNAASYKNYHRQSDEPEEFAKATLWHAVRMVYADDNFSMPQIKILNVGKESGNLLLSLQISWRDRWTPNPYIIKGNLTVNNDGSNGKFVITYKNIEAEALEVTNPNTKSTLVLPTI